VNDLKQVLAYLAGGVLMGALLGWLLCAQCNKPPVITTGITDTIIVSKPTKPDTVYKDREHIAVKIKRDTTRIIDTLFVPDVNVNFSDDTVCWSFADSVRGAKIGAEICSKNIPKEKPLDLKAMLTIQLPPDTTREISRIDTVSRTTPFYRDWKSYALLIAIAVSAGLATGHIR
jgi:hypothetical protein